MAWLFIACLGVVAPSCEAPAEKPPPRIAPVPSPKPEATEFTLSLVGLNDLHGRIRALPVFAGGVQNLRQSLAGRGEVAVLDAGDMIHGTLEANLNEGADVIRAYNAMNVSAATLGNHEFDFGAVGRAQRIDADPQGALRARLEEAQFPVVASNLIRTDFGANVEWKGLFERLLLEIGPLRVGFIGTLTEEADRVIQRGMFAGLAVTPAHEAITRQAKKLREEGADLVVVLSHAGGECQSVDDPYDLSSCDDGEIFRVVRSLEPGLVDVVFAGHVHHQIAHFVEGVAVVESFWAGSHFSRVDLHFARDEAGAPWKKRELTIHPPTPLCTEAHAPCELTEYAGRPVERDPAVARVVDEALSNAAAQRERLVGVEVLRPFVKIRHQEHPVGSLFAEALLAAASPPADVALINAGAVRASLPAGQLKYGDLFDAYPFDGRVVRIEIVATELEAVIAKHLSNDDHGLMHMAGVRARAACEGEKLRVRLERPDGTKIEDADKLVLVTNDFMATGGDSLLDPIPQVTMRSRIKTDETLRDVVAGQLAKRTRPLNPDDREFFDPTLPRISYPGERPVRCR